MIHLIQRHKNKLLALTPVLLIVLIALGAVYILGLDKRRVLTQNISQEERLIRIPFDNIHIESRAYLVYDKGTRTIISGKNESSQLPLASLTKIMAALVALDLAPRDQLINIPTESQFNSSFDRKNLIPGKWRLDDLLRLTLISSSNSGINTISNALSSRFVELMNQKAQKLGLNQTFFLNESGLDINQTLSGGNGSAKDMARLFDYALDTAPDIFGSTKFDSIVINSSSGRPEEAKNTNPGVGKIDGLIASKTGLTDLAGGNLAIAFDAARGKRVLIVVLGSTQEGRFTDAEALANATIKYFKLKQP